MMTIHQQLWTSGYAEGFAGSFIDSIVKCRAEAFLFDLCKRFGPLPEAIPGRVCSASPAQLDNWKWAASDARTLEDVFRHAVVR